MKDRRADDGIGSRAINAHSTYNSKGRQATTWTSHHLDKPPTGQADQPSTTLADDHAESVRDHRHLRVSDEGPKGRRWNRIGWRAIDAHSTYNSKGRQADKQTSRQADKPPPGQADQPSITQADEHAIGTRVSYHVMVAWWCET